jgi:hypothetical protein
MSKTIINRIREKCAKAMGRIRGRPEPSTLSDVSAYGTD